jgi:hypothetical protein
MEKLTLSVDPGVVVRANALLSVFAVESAH